MPTDERKSMGSTKIPKYPNTQVPQNAPGSCNCIAYVGIWVLGYLTSSDRQRLADVDPMSQAISGIIHVFLRPTFQLAAFFSRERASDPGGGADDQRAFGYPGSGCNQSFGPDETLISDDRAIQDDGAHPDQTLVPHRGRVHNGRVPHRHPIAQQTGKIVGEVKDGVVLNVGVMADDDPV